MSDLIEGDVTEQQSEVEDAQEQAPVQEDSEDEEIPSEDVSSDQEEVHEDPEPMVTFGDENPEEQAEESVPFKQMRRALREKEKSLRDMQKQIDALKAPEPAKQLRKKPTLADHDYDEAAYESDLEKYTVEKRDIERDQEKAKEQQKAIQVEFEEKVSSFQDSYSNLSYGDKDDAMQEVLSKFNEQQQGVILDAVDNPAMIVYALGKNPKKLEELAGIKNLIRLSSQLGQLETQMKVTNRKVKAAPDKSVKSTSGISAVIDKTLEKLENEADKTGDRTALIRYKRNLKNKQ